MFHTSVLASSGNVVDFDRASFLMDCELLQASIAARDYERDHAPRWDCCGYGAQWVWEEYCELHLEKYDEYFIPDVDPAWDRPSVPVPAKPIDLGERPELNLRMPVWDRNGRLVAVYPSPLASGRRDRHQVRRSQRRKRFDTA